MNRDLKSIVRDKYSEIAQQSKEQNQELLLRAGGCSTVDYTIFSEDYSKPERLQRRCRPGTGLRPAHRIRPDQEGTVVDLRFRRGERRLRRPGRSPARGKVLGWT
ncbi:MAG: hypothetical protein R2787_06755 [Saprospiraceae bacterium]